MDIYNLNNDLFLSFLTNSNQKELVSDYIKNQISKNDKKIIISDIWAWNWVIARNIIKHLEENKITYEYNFIEPSEKLVWDFLENLWENKNVNIKNNKIEEVWIENSDIIILSFVVHLIPDINIFLEYIYNKLNQNWKIIIINQSTDNIDNKLKAFLWQQIYDYTWYLINLLNSNNIFFELKKKNSLFRWYDDIVNLTEKWKAFLSLMSLCDIKSLDENLIQEMLKLIKENQKNGNIIRSEDYITIYKK